MNTSHEQARGAGPLRHATVIVADFKPLLQAYAALGLAASEVGHISTLQAQAWGQPQLAGHATVFLAASAHAAPLLRLIEVPGTPARPTRFSHGWLALEVLVRDVDSLAAALPGAGFEVVGPPADLDVSPNIRAMQVVGPAGEMLYLTQVRAPVPPFDIPLSAQLPVDQPLGAIFIAVLSTPSREAVVRACEPLGSGAVLRFDTKVTVLNRALGHAVDKRWPVATVQWAGQCLFEVDEVVDAQVGAAAPTGVLPAGLAWVAMAGAMAQGQGSGALMEISPGAWVEWVGV
jgi:hypothetical protein